MRIRLSFFLLIISVPFLRSETIPDSILIKLADLVREYDQPDQPGFAIAVIKDQELIFKYATGLANMEYDIPLTTKSIFNIASISKQFTAASIAMLAIEGKLSLEDPVTSYIPELPEFYRQVKLRHMIHMESGIRDFYILHHLRGHGENVYCTTVGETIELLGIQKSLYFAPGSQTDYCNTNYLLLAEIVKRVSGKSLREFADERIFKPLGMVNTHFHDDRTEIVKNRATAYYLGEFSEIFIFRDLLNDTSNIKKGFKVAPESYVFDLVGQSQLYTTVEDLYLWDRNFYTHEVGGDELISMLLTTSTLNNGEANDYAFGLIHGTYGHAQLKTISHSGGTNGYLSYFVRFPNEEFSVIYITNNTGSDQSIVDRIIQICLEDELSVRSRSIRIDKQVVDFESNLFDLYSGKYEIFPGFFIEFSRDGDHFYAQPTGQEKIEIFPSSDTSFFLKVVDAQVDFHADEEGICNEITWHQGGQNYEALRFLHIEPGTTDLAEYTGTYYSDELDVTYQIYLREDELFLRYKSYMPIFTEPLIPSGEDRFHAQAMWKIDFKRDDNGIISSMILRSPVGIGKMRFVPVK